MNNLEETLKYFENTIASSRETKPPDVEYPEPFGGQFYVGSGAFGKFGKFGEPRQRQVVSGVTIFKLVGILALRTFRDTRSQKMAISKKFLTRLEVLNDPRPRSIAFQLCRRNLIELVRVGNPPSIAIMKAMGLTWINAHYGDT